MCHAICRKSRSVRYLWMVTGTISAFVMVCMAGWTRWAIVHSRSGFVEQLERIMFVKSEDIFKFKQQCGADWHEIFEEWDQRQQRFLRGDLDVKVVVWRCEEICGGLGDRQRGILTSFMLALTTQRAFLIDSRLPVPLHHYFHVANPAIHWLYEEKLIRGRSVFEEVFMDVLPSVGDYASADLSLYDAYDVIIQKNNFWRPLSILENRSVDVSRKMQAIKPHVLAGCLLNYLLVPAVDLQLRIHRLLQQAGNSELVAVQVRSGDNQSKNLTVVDSLVSAFDTCVKSVQGSTPALFLTTDSGDVYDRFQTLHPNMLSFDGQIMHVDGFFGSQTDPDAAFQKVVLDHIMISQAQHLIISRSGFAEFAALRGFRSYFVPPNCGANDMFRHYSFPADIPAGVPAFQLHSVQDVLMPSFESRGKF